MKSKRKWLWSLGTFGVLGVGLGVTIPLIAISSVKEVHNFEVSSDGIQSNINNGLTTQELGEPDIAWSRYIHLFYDYKGEIVGSKNLWSCEVTKENFKQNITNQVLVPKDFIINYKFVPSSVANGYYSDGFIEVKIIGYSLKNGKTYISNPIKVSGFMTLGDFSFK